VSCAAFTAGVPRKTFAKILLFNNGAYAEYMRIPGRIVMENMLEVPHSVDDGSAALVEPLACVLRGIHEMECAPATPAVVIGCGPIGLKYVRMLRVVAWRVHRSRPPGWPHSKLRDAMGAVATINVTQVRDVVAAVRNLTEDGRGADSVVELPAILLPGSSAGYGCRAVCVNFFKRLSPPERAWKSFSRLQFTIRR